jgi:stage II sporulation protein D
VRRPLAIAAAGALALALAPPAQGASSLVVSGAGFGHGVGFSQYGALGAARAGLTAPRILRHYYTGTALGRLSASPTVRVLLDSGRRSYTVAGAVRAGGRALDPGRTYRVSAGGQGLLLRDAQSGRALLTSAAPMVLDARDGGLQATGGTYRGRLEVRPGAGGLSAVNAVGLEDYVAGVIAAEMPSAWPAEALKAQAIAARTYAITSNAGGASGFFTQYEDTRSQVYRGVGAETPSTSAAVRATAGQVVTYEGRPVTTFFFSTSGGRTENVENSFLGATPKPWLKSVRDPWDRVSPHHRWKPLRMSLARASTLLGGSVKGTLREIRVVQRGVSPRVVRATVIGSGGRTTVTGPQLRKAFGLRDTWMRLRVFTTNAGRGTPAPPVPPASPDLPGALPSPAKPPVAADPGGSGGAQASGAPLVISGRVAPAAPGSWATVQRRQGARWARSIDVRLGAGGAYREALPGPGRYRLSYGGATGPEVSAG